MKPQFAILSLVVACQFLSACSGSGQGTNKSPLAPQLQEMGTGDGGGGNAIDYKMLESHLIDPREMNLVKNRLNPMFQKMFNSPDSEQAYNYFGMKNWYLAPIKLKTIPKEVIGIEFTADRHQQVAIQTEQAIWIDSNIFEKMDENEKARLLAHEVLMSVYLTRFLTLEDLCKTHQRMTEGEVCEELSEEMSNLPQYQPEAQRKLTEVDYERIRAMTAWFFRNEADLSLEKYTKHAQQIGFSDKRFYSRDSEDNLKISQKDLMLALEKTRMSGRLMSTCKAVNTKKSFNCEVSWEQGTQADPKFANAVINYVQFTVRDSATKKVIQSSKAAIHETIDHHLNRVDATTYLASLVPLELMATQQSGHQESMVMIAFDLDRSGKLSVKNLLFSPQIFVQSSFIDEKREENGEVYTCEIRSFTRPHPKSLETDLVLLNTFEGDEVAVAFSKIINLDGFKNCSLKE